MPFKVYIRKSHNDYLKLAGLQQREDNIPSKWPIIGFLLKFARTGGHQLHKHLCKECTQLVKWWLKWYRDHHTFFGGGGEGRVWGGCKTSSNCSPLKSSNRAFLSSKSLPTVPAESTSLPGELCSHRQWSLCTHWVCALTHCLHWVRSHCHSQKGSSLRAGSSLIQSQVHCNSLVLFFFLEWERKGGSEYKTYKLSQF